MEKYTDFIFGTVLLVLALVILFLLTYVLLSNQKNIEACMEDNINNGWSTAPCYHKPNKSYVVNND